MQDFYSVLGVSKNASKSEIKSGIYTSGSFICFECSAWFWCYAFVSSFSLAKSFFYSDFYFQSYSGFELMFMWKSIELEKCACLF